MKLKVIKRTKGFLSAHPRLRVLLIFLVIMTIIVIVVNNLAQPKPTTSLGNSYVAGPNGQLVKGSTQYSNKVYSQLNQASQEQAIKQAESNGQTIVAESTQQVHPKEYKMSNQDAHIEEITGSHLFKKIVEREAVQKQYKPAAESNTNKLQEIQQEKQQRTRAYLNAVSEKTSQMDSQVRAMVTGWSHVTPQENMVAKAITVNATASGQSQGSRDGNVIEKAGSILFAVLDTQLNSDQPGTPVMATIVQGKFKKAKLLGNFKRETDKLVIVFDKMSLPALDHSISIKAYAINATTAQNALASDVDNHYLLRYGSLFASAFLQGFGDYFSQNSTSVCGSSSTCIITGDQSNNQANRTTRHAVYSGLGQVGTILANKASRQFDRPPTVTLNQGVGMGILFMSDVKV